MTLRCEPDTGDAQVLAQAIDWLKDAAAHGLGAGSETLTLARQQQIGTQLGPSVAAMIAQLLENRLRAKLKFSQAERMFFLRRWLEQATSERIAAYKAARLTAGGTRRIWDVGCGLGGDLLELTRLNSERTCGVDRDPCAVRLAQSNCLALARAAEVRLADAASVRPQPDDVMHIDPDRRIGGRITAWERLAPSPDLLARLASAARRAAIKLAPATRPPEDWLSRGEREWIGEQREVKQQVLWISPSEPGFSQGCRRATVVHADGRSDTLTPLEGLASALAPESEPAGYLWDPHAAVRAANLTGDLAAQRGASRLEGNGEYLTAEEPCWDGLAASFQVLASLAWDPRRLKRILSAHEPAELEVKTRGVNMDPEHLSRQLRGGAGPRLTLVIYAQGRRKRAILARRWTGA